MVRQITCMVLLIAACYSTAVVSADVLEAGKREQALGKIDSLDPIGIGTAGNVTFSAKASFAGVGSGPTAEQHTITLRLLVVDEDGKVICNQKQDWTVANAEQGCIKCPVTCTQAVEPGAYFINATLTDVGPNGKKVRLDVKSAAVILN
jgi:hypothetical protein